MTRRLPVAAVMLGAACSVGASGVHTAPAAAAGGQAFVRVNQVGYPAAAAKRAYLLSRVSERGAPFAVRTGATVVLRGRVGAPIGRWSARYPHVYALDLSAVHARGAYTVTVGGAAPATSPQFRIAAAAVLYAPALRNALAFYQAERDGPDFVRSPLRTAPGHLNDGHAMTYRTPKVDGDGIFAGDLTPLGVRTNAAGGWWDAGDYLKFVQTTGYTDAVLLTGVRDAPRRMGRVRVRGASFAAEAAFGARWLLHMWDDRTRTLYYQVGIGEGNDQTLGDHDIWRLPQADDTWGGGRAGRYIRNRPVFRAGPPGSTISPNLAGRDAAAFGLCHQVFRHTRPRLAARCLRSGEHIFALADTHPGRLLTVIPYDFYPETEWRDDLEWGAAELAIATGSRFYLRRAAHWAHAYITGPNDAADTLNLYDASALAHADLARAIAAAGYPAGLQVSRASLVGDLRRQLARALAQGRTDAFGFGFPWATYDTASHGFGLAVTASLYDRLTHTQRYAAAGGRWLANVLGANAWGASLAVGDGTTFPQCMQHQVANVVGSLDGSPPILAGAVVEGPNSAPATGLVDGMRRCPGGGGDRFARFNSRAVFRDNVQSYSTVEPAIDLTATSPLAFALQ